MKNVRERLIKNKSFKKGLVIVSILFVVTFLYGFVLWNFDLTLTNTTDYNYGLNPCFSKNEYNGGSRIFVCMIYYEEKVIDKIFGTT